MKLIVAIKSELRARLSTVEEKKEKKWYLQEWNNITISSSNFFCRRPKTNTICLPMGGTGRLICYDKWNC